MRRHALTFAYLAPLATFLLLAPLPRPAVGQSILLPASLAPTPETSSLRPLLPSGRNESYRDYLPAVVLVGYPEHAQGTGFVISKKHRLVATNAHVADYLAEAGALRVMCNGSPTTYTVDRVWYHPGVMRQYDGTLAVRSQDPLAGPVQKGCPDVAVLHLSAGPDLPAEFPLATPEDLRDLFSRGVAMFGYPGHDTQRWPAEGQVPQASFQEGVVTRLYDFRLNVNAPHGQLQMVQHSMAGWFGTSGSPVFLPSGRVVAINSTRWQGWSGSDTTSCGFAVRIDCLWELLAHHSLLEQVETGDVRPTLDLVRYATPDPREAEMQSARRLLEACPGLVKHKHFAVAVEYCNQALRLAPEYAKARLARSRVLCDHAIELLGKGQRDIAKQELEAALDDALKYDREASSDDHWGELDACRYALWMEVLLKGDPSNQRVVERLQRFVGNSTLENQQRAYAFRLRAAAVNSAEASFADLNEALRLAPYGRPGQDAYLARAAYWQKRGDVAKAQADTRRAEQLQRAETLAEEARELLTSRTSIYRDDEPLKKAFDLARQACELTDFAQWQHLQLLAEASHKLGNSGLAFAWSNKALGLAPSIEKRRIQQDLRTYRTAGLTGVLLARDP